MPGGRGSPTYSASTRSASAHRALMVIPRALRSGTARGAGTPCAGRRARSRAPRAACTPSRRIADARSCSRPQSRAARTCGSVVGCLVGGRVDPDEAVTASRVANAGARRAVALRRRRRAGPERRGRCPALSNCQPWYAHSSCPPSTTRPERQRHVAVRAAVEQRAARFPPSPRKRTIGMPRSVRARGRVAELLRMARTYQWRSGFTTEARGFWDSPAIFAPACPGTTGRAREGSASGSKPLPSAAFSEGSRDSEVIRAAFYSGRVRVHGSNLRAHVRRRRPTRPP